MTIPFAMVFVAAAGASFVSAQYGAQDCYVATTDPNEAEIVRAVCSGNAARRDYPSKLEVERKARDLALEATDDPEIRFRRLRAWKAADVDLHETENRMNGGFNRAIELALSHYGISPSRGEGPILGGPATNGMALWGPRYRPRVDQSAVIIEEIALPNDKAIHLKWKPDEDPKKRPGAITFANGRIDVYDETMNRVLETGSARQLGFVLHHESVHFDQLRNGHWATMHLREVEAYRESRKAMGRFGLTKDERRDVVGLFWENFRLVATEGIRNARPSDLPGPDEEKDNADAWGKLAQGIEGARGDRKKLEATLKQEQEDRLLREAVAARERESQERRDQSSRLFTSLEAISQRLCEAAVDGVVPQDLYMEWLTWRNGNYLAFSADQQMADLSGLRRPFDCAVFFANQVLVARRNRYNHDVVTFDWAAEVVHEAYRRSHPSTPSLPPQTRTPDSQPVEAPTDPFPGEENPRVPTIPHCRYHPWCKDKTASPREN